MSSFAYRTAPHAREAEIIGRKALEFLSKNRLDLTPRNFELIYEVLTGRDKALREAFVALPKPVSQAVLSMVAQQFLPERPCLRRSRASAKKRLARWTVSARRWKAER